MIRLHFQGRSTFPWGAEKVGHARQASMNSSRSKRAQLALIIYSGSWLISFQSKA